MPEDCLKSLDNMLKIENGKILMTGEAESPAVGLIGQFDIPDAIGGRAVIIIFRRGGE
jgi:hypothetical protein